MKQCINTLAIYRRAAGVYIGGLGKTPAANGFTDPMDQIIVWLEQYGLAAVFLNIVLEQLGLPIPA